MRLLIIGRNAWDDTNCLGNTMSNLFSNWAKEDIAYLYTNAAKPNNVVCKYYFSISDHDVLMSLFGRKENVGSSFIWEKKVINNDINKDEINEEKIYKFFQNKQKTLAYIIQEILWKFGKWKSTKLQNFIITYNPDVIFALSFYSLYLYRLMNYIQKRTKSKVVYFHDDDRISIKRSMSPIKYIYKFLISSTVVKNSRKADINYCISKQMQEEYSKKIGREMKLLYKGANFNIEPIFKTPSKTIKIVFIGSILYGRWKTLGLLIKIIKKNYEKDNIFKIIIYSQIQPTKKILKVLNVENVSIFAGKVSSNEIYEIQRNADIVLHVESFEKAEKAITRLSFSTKIVDYLNCGSCLMAIGPKETASIDYLLKNQVAIVATCENEINQLLDRINKNPSEIVGMAKKAWEFGKNNHKIEKIQEHLYNDLNNLIKEH